MLRIRLTALATALCIGAFACTVDTPTAVSHRPHLQTTFLGGLICQLDNTVSGITDIRLQDIANEVCRAFNAGEITPEEANSYFAKIAAAQAALERGQVGVAVNVLNALVNELQGQYVNKLCSPGDVRPVCITLKKLIDDVQHLLGQLT